VLPEDLAVLVEAEQQSLGAVGVDVARLRITDHVGPAQPDADDVGVPDVELVFQRTLPSFSSKHITRSCSSSPSPVLLMK